MRGRRLPRGLSLVVVGVLLATSHSASAAQTDPALLLPPGGTFLDDDWNFAEGAIEAIASEGVTTGCAPQRFCPDRVLTRAEAAALIARILESGPGPLGVFPDVDDQTWYAEAVASLAAIGVVTGHEDGTFRPADPLSRAEMAQLLVRAFDDRIQVVYEPVLFADVSSEAVYAAAVGRLAQGGITTGCATNPGRYCPDQPVLRDQMAMFLARVLGLELRVPPKRIAPLNGQPIKGLDWNRRVVAVKIDDHRGARPQSGVDQADAMVETLVEGGLTRWIALFHQSDSPYLGPVRSLRPTDIGLALPLSATMAASGGQPWIIDRAVAEGVQVLRERDARPALFRISERSSPHNLYADTAKLRSVADVAGYTDAAPVPLFGWGRLPDGPIATTISLEWSDPITVSWNWDGQRYRRWRGGHPHNWVLPNGSLGQVSADSLIVLMAPASELAPPPGVLGSPVPILDTVGQGPVFVFAEGRFVRGLWSRANKHESFVFTTLGGEPLPVPPGTPWINVFPDGRTIHS